MSDITRIDETINFNIDDTRYATEENVTIMETRTSELRDYSDHVRELADNIEGATEGYSKVVNLLEELEEAIEHVDGEADGAMSDADNIDTSY